MSRDCRNRTPAAQEKRFLSGRTIQKKTAGDSGTIDYNNL